jgi:hypothetical protein
MHSLDVQASGIAMRSTLVATVVEDGAVLLDLETKYFYALNESGWAIAQLFENTAASFDLIFERCALWGARREDEAAIHAFLNAMRDYGLLEECAPSQTAPPVEYKSGWSAPSVTRQREPLQTIVTSAFDPSVPLAE